MYDIIPTENSTEVSDMIKRISAAILSFSLLLCLCSCNLGSEKENGGLKNNVSVTAKSTAVHNHFKDRVPGFDFKNKPVEKYEDGLSYSLSVKCSDREYSSYLKKLKKSGFEINPVEADSYYSASDEKGYYVEVTYVNEMLTIYVGTA